MLQNEIFEVFGNEIFNLTFQTVKKCIYYLLKLSVKRPTKSRLIY